MKRLVLDIIMAAGIAASILFSGFKCFAVQCENIQTEVLRLHIPANSNSEFDQSLKLSLRDYILENYSTRLSAQDNLKGAEADIAALLPQLEADCNRFLTENGADYGATANLCEMYFTTRTYDNVTLPAGTYKALRITLGSGEGQNWWCVMFPPLCIPIASEYKDALPDALVSDGESIKVEFKFAIFEFFKSLFN